MKKIILITALLTTFTTQAKNINCFYIEDEKFKTYIVETKSDNSQLKCFSGVVLGKRKNKITCLKGSNPYYLQTGEMMKKYKSNGVIYKLYKICN